MDGLNYLLVLCSLAVGAAGGVLASWNVHLRLYRIEREISELMRVSIRETKARAAKERWEKPSTIDVEQALKNQTAEVEWTPERIRSAYYQQQAGKR